MRVRVLWVGSTKERFIEEGIGKYLKLLKPYADMRIEEIKEEKKKPVEAALKAEGERILKRAEPFDGACKPFVLLEEKGKAMTSEGFAGFIKTKETVGRMDFVLGGAFGVSKEVRERASARISLSSMTLTHEMARLVFLEQLYRAFTINAGKGYHHS